MGTLMRRSMLVVWNVTLAVCVSQSVAAQVSALRPGARVRVTTTVASATPIIGVLDSVSGGKLFVRRRPESMTPLPFDQVGWLEVSRGRKRPTWSKTAPLWLTISAGGVGAIVGYNTSSDDDFFGRDFGALALGTVGGVLGLLVGTGLAFGVKEDKWEAVILPRGGRASVVPSFYVAARAGRPTVGMRTAF